MYDVHFNLNGMEIIYKDCLTTENKLKSSVNGLLELIKTLSSEISSFDSESHSAISEMDGKIAKVRSLISNVENKKITAQSKKKQELLLPTPPSIPLKATPEEKSAIMSSYQRKVQQIERANSQIRNENACIDAFSIKCDSAVAKLKEIISHLQEIKSSIATERIHALSEAKGSMSKATTATVLFPSVEKAIHNFYICFGNTYEDAKELAMMSPKEIKTTYYVHKQFEIKNHHSGVNFGAGLSSNSSNVSLISSSSHSSYVFSDDEILIGDREDSAFFDKAENIRKIKMPGANLHKLGGKAFIAKMKAKGYILQVLSDGKVIDDSGMMHWIKEDE